MSDRLLVLMRHAKAADSASSDRERPLAEAGRRQAVQAGQLLGGRGIAEILCSDALRCRQTAELLGLRMPDPQGRRPAEAGAQSPVPIHPMAALYLAGSETIAQRISEIPDQVTGLLVVAHSPGLPELAAELTWASSHRDADQLGCHYPTAHFTAFRIPGAWAELAEPGYDRAKPVSF